MLDPIQLEPTLETPRIILNLETGKFLFEGISIPENAAIFYQPIIEWFTKLQEIEYTKPIEIHFKIKYYNSSSYARISKIISIAEKLYSQNKNIKILWYYHFADETTKEDGYEFQKHHKIPFDIISFE